MEVGLGRGGKREVRAQPAGRSALGDPAQERPGIREVEAGRLRALGPAPTGHWLGPPPRQ